MMISKIKHFCIKMQDILITDAIYLVPCLCKWFYHLKIKRDVFRIPLSNSSGKKSSLYRHGVLGTGKGKNQAVLILHGLYSHPFIMIHLAEMAQRSNIGPVFSLYLSYDEENLGNHRAFINQALDSIEKIMKDQTGSSNGIVLVGHSMGAIEGAYSALVERDKRILSVISIAGRLKVIESTHCPCKASLIDSLNKINEGIQLNTSFPLYQIVGRKDWNASLESTIIHKKEGYYHIVDDAMHFNILFHKELRQKFPEYLKKIMQNARLIH